MAKKKKNNAKEVEQVNEPVVIEEVATVVEEPEAVAEEVIEEDVAEEPVAEDVIIEKKEDVVIAEKLPEPKQYKRVKVIDPFSGYGWNGLEID